MEVLLDRRRQQEWEESKHGQKGVKGVKKLVGVEGAELVPWGPATLGGAWVGQRSRPSAL